MIVKAKVAGFEFETTLDLFFMDNPRLVYDKSRVEEELSKLGDATIGPVSSAHVVPCFLTLVED